MKQKEASVHYQVAQYLKSAYPKVIFRTDFAAGIKMTMGQAVKHASLQSGRAYPDLFIAEPKIKIIREEHNFGRDERSVWYSTYSGLFIELKREGAKLKRDKDANKINKGDHKIRKAGDWFDQHIEEQATMLEELSRKGYCATFAVGFDEAKNIIDQYLK